MDRRRPTQFRRRRIRVWGFSLSQVLIGLAIVVLAASAFLPAFRVQCAAAKLASQQQSRSLQTTP